MEPSENAFEMIKAWEGLHCRAYKALPSERYYTIGYGHCSPEVKKGQYITVKEAEQLLKNDVAQYSQLLAAVNPTLLQHQYDVLISLIYNIGWHNFITSMTGVVTASLNRKTTPIDVARRIILWVRSGEKVVLGLQRRRVMEANYFLGYECFTLDNGEIHEHCL
jgi:GH24 family phage-related lysozyme (muramidase)